MDVIEEYLDSLREIFTVEVLQHRKSSNNGQSVNPAAGI
jgi:hypothetical protein